MHIHPIRHLAPAILLLCGILAAPSGAGPISFLQAERFGGGPSFYSSSAAELDGTTGLDIAAVRNDGALVLILNDGAGFFGTPHVLFASGAYALATGDLNGDARADIAVGRTSPNRVSWLRQIGGGAFAAPVDVDMPSTVTSIKLADVNYDGRIDLLVVYGWNAGLGVWLNDGAGNFTSAGTYLVGSGFLDIDVARVDGDSALDIVVPCWSYSDTQMLLLLGHGDGSFAAPVAIGDPVPSTALVRVVDMDGDGLADLVDLGYDTSTRFGVSKGNGLGGFAIRHDTYFPDLVEGLITNKVIGDFDGDGFPDVVAVVEGVTLRPAANQITIARNDGHGSFTVGLRYEYGYLGEDWSNQILLADLTGDGLPDFLVTGHGFALVRGLPGGHVAAPQWATYPESTSYNGTIGTGGFAASQLVVGQGPDLLVSAFDYYLPGANGIIRLTNHDDGTFADGVMWLPGEQLVGHFDLNNDGVDDQLITSSATDVTSWINDGNGHLTIAQSFPVPPALSQRWIAPPWLMVADANGDAIPDLWSRGADDSLVIRPGQGGGTFGPPQPTGVWFPSGSRSVSVACAADLDGDGRSDLCYAVQVQADPNYRLFVHHNNGALRFGVADSVDLPYAHAGQGPFPVGPPFFLGAGDVNGDLRLDLVLVRAVSGGGGGLETFLRGADGGYTVGPGALAAYFVDATLSDFDGDGRSDLLAALSTGTDDDFTNVYQGQPDGSLALAFQARVCDMAGSVAAADLNGDGLVDFAEVSGRNAQVVIYLNGHPPDQPTPVLASLASSRSVDGHVELAWQVQGATTLTIERSTDGYAWAGVATALPDGVGRVTYTDTDVKIGALPVLVWLKVAAPAA